jgi:hypothetical protein
MTSASATTPEIQNGNIITRTVNVNITGSLANFAMAGPLGAIWKPVEGKQTRVFGAMGDNMDATLATNQLRTALIHELNILEHKSSFPVALGVKINCIPASEFTDLGQAYAYTVLPLSVNTAVQNVYTCDASATSTQNWRNEYPRWNNTNLEKEGVMEVSNCPYVFVSQDHPIIALLRSNSALIGCDIDEQPRIDNEWLKVTRQVLSACCQTLRTKVLSKIATNDMNTIQLQLERLAADSWDDVNDINLPMQGFVCNPLWTPEENEKAKRLHVQQFLSTPYSYMARVQIKYEVQTPS